MLSSSKRTEGTLRRVSWTARWCQSSKFNHQASFMQKRFGHLYCLYQVILSTHFFQEFIAKKLCTLTIIPLLRVCFEICGCYTNMNEGYLLCFHSSQCPLQEAYTRLDLVFLMIWNFCDIKLMTYMPFCNMAMAHSLWTLCEHGNIWQPLNASCK